MKRIGDKVYQKREKEMYLASKPASLEAVLSDQYYPTTVLFFPSVSRNKSVHPTQKSVELSEYLIKTYTDEGDTVLDSFSGSGTVGVACVHTKRSFILIECENTYFQKGMERVRKEALKK